MAMLADFSSWIDVEMLVLFFELLIVARFMWSIVYIAFGRAFTPYWCVLGRLLLACFLH